MAYLLAFQQPGKNLQTILSYAQSNPHTTDEQRRCPNKSGKNKLHNKIARFPRTRPSRSWQRPLPHHVQGKRDSFVPFKVSYSGKWRSVNCPPQVFRVVPEEDRII